LVIIHDADEGFLIDNLSFEHLGGCLTDDVLVEEAELWRGELTRTPVLVLLRRRELRQVRLRHTEDRKIDTVAFSEVGLEECNNLVSSL